MNEVRGPVRRAARIRSEPKASKKRNPRLSTVTRPTTPGAAGWDHDHRRARKREGSAPLNCRTLRWRWSRARVRWAGTTGCSSRPSETQIGIRSRLRT